MQQLYGTVGDTLSSVAPGTWLCAVAAVVNLALLLVMHADLDRTDGMAFSRHGVVFVIFTLATSALSCVIPGGAGFFFTFLVISVLPAIFALILVAALDPDIQAQLEADSRKKAASVPQVREERPVYRDRYGTQIYLIDGLGGYTDWDGNPYTLYGTTAVPVRHLAMTDEGDYIYVTYQNGEYHDDFNNRWRKSGGTLSRL
jgi:hypothetical protein